MKMNRNLAILDAPSNLGLMAQGAGREPGARYLAAALRRHGLVEQLGAHDAGAVAAQPYDPHRPADSRLLNGPAIRDYTLQLAGAVDGLVGDGYFPLVLGGDCSILLGTLLGLRRRGRYGLAYLDGHRDFQTPATSQTGGAAGMDLALVTGRGPQLLTRFDGYERLVDDEAVVVLGYRDHAEPAEDGSRAIYETSLRLLDLAAVRRLGPARAAEEALAQFRASSVEGFWIHFDVDVLDSTAMPAVDAPQADGLSYAELQGLLRPLLASDLAAGMQVTIYDPERDPGGEAGRQLAPWLVSLLTS
jgi:arginase